jgi:hypothetical protein
LNSSNLHLQKNGSGRLNFRIWSYLLLLPALLITAESAAYQQEFRIAGSFQTMRVDETGRIYLISGQNVHIYDNRGHLLATERFDGKPMSLELTQENEIFLFYQGSQKILVTTGNLAKRRTLSFEKSGISNPGPACYAGQGQIWVYDRDEEKLKLLDHNLEVRRTSEPLSGFAFHTLNPLSLVRYNDKLLINNDGHEVLIFNRFGSYVDRLDVRTHGHIQIADGNIFFIRHGRPQAMNINTGRVEELVFPFGFGTVNEFLIRNNRLYVLSHGGLSVYEK